MANYGYDKNTDYTKLINQAVSMGDYRTAAIREAQRNEKIRGEGLTKYQTTSHYSDYLPRTDQINSGMDRLAEQKTWSYDPANDPAWQAARKQYLREAERGTRDTMASYAGMTGGVPSTAAVSAGQQAGNYYRSQLMDRLPEYMQQDYSRWANNREMDRADLQTLAALDQQAADNSLNLQQWDWQKEGDLWQRNYTEQQAAIAAAMDRWATLGYADQSVADTLGVAVGTSTQDAQYRQWQQSQTERSDAYDRAMTWIQMGIMPDDATLNAAGINKAQAQAAVNKVQQQYVARSAGGGGSRSRSSAGGGGRDGDLGKTKIDETDPQNGPDGPKYTDAERKEAYTKVKYYLNMSAKTGDISYATRAIDYYADYLTDDMAAEVMSALDRLSGKKNQSEEKKKKAQEEREKKRKQQKLEQLYPDLFP